MANLVVAGICNLECAYCFAPPEAVLPANRDGRRRQEAFLSLEAYEERLQFLDRSGIPEARLIGGEPTLHPQFPELIRLARLHGKRILVFTNGLVKESALACLEALPPDECTVLVNMNASRGLQDLEGQEAARRLETLRRLGRRALPGMNIYRTDFRLDGLLRVIEEMGCRKAIRLGLAQPMLSGRNQYLHPKQYPIIGQKIARLAGQAGQAGVCLEFDCGFVRCMFSEKSLEELRRSHADFGWRCNPILDIGLDGRAVHCFPLAGKVAAPVEGSSTAAGIRTMMSALVRPFRTAGIYRECSTCPYKTNHECTGGCLANTMLRFRHSPIRVSVPEKTAQAVPI